MVSFSLPLKEPSQNQLQLPTLAGMLQAPGRVVPQQLGGTQGLEEQLERRRRLGHVARVAGLAIGLAAVAPAVVTSCTKGDPEEPDEEQLQGDIAPTMGIVAPPEAGGGGE